MSWFTSSHVESLQKLFTDSIACLYDCELRLIDRVPVLATACRAEELRMACDDYADLCRANSIRLEACFDQLGLAPDRESAKAMQALIDEAGECVASFSADEVCDAALVGALQAIIHYQMAWYGTTRTHARFLGHHEVAERLQESLDQAGDFDRRLTVLAESGINAQALG